jgi:RNA polymerase primary sigma factor
MTVLDTISNEENETITNLEANENKKTVSKLLSRLDPRLRGIIKSLYGLDDENYKTLHDVGEDLNLSRERIRQLRDQALKILKSESRFLKYNI